MRFQLPLRPVALTKIGAIVPSALMCTYASQHSLLRITNKLT